MEKRTLLLSVCLLLISGFTNPNVYAQGNRTNNQSRQQPPRNGSTAKRPTHLVIAATDGNLIGGFDGVKWLDAGQAMPALREGETYRLYTLTGQAGTGTFSKPEKSESPCEDLVEARITPLPAGENPNLIGVNGDWNAQPRLPKVQNTNQQEYRDVVASFLKGAGINNPQVKILQLLRVDLEGDGVEEVLISANSSDQQAMIMSKGDFSVVLLRKVVGGASQIIPLVSEVETKEPKDPRMDGKYHHMETVVAILDINGDGVMEVITNYQSAFDVGKNVYEIKGRRRPKVVFGWGCSDEG